MGRAGILGADPSGPEGSIGEASFVPRSTEESGVPSCCAALGAGVIREFWVERVLEACVVGCWVFTAEAAGDRRCQAGPGTDGDGGHGGSPFVLAFSR